MASDWYTESEQEMDDRDAAIAQMQLEERRRREGTEASVRKSMDDFKRQLDEWLNDFNESPRRL